MKHPVFSNCLLAAVALSVVSSSATATAQGTVVFQNDSRGLVYSWQGANDPTPMLGSPKFHGVCLIRCRSYWSVTKLLSRPRPTGKNPSRAAHIGQRVLGTPRLTAP
jgi:hypothetical protein